MNNIKAGKIHARREGARRNCCGTKSLPAITLENFITQYQTFQHAKNEYCKTCVKSLRAMGYTLS